MRKLEISPRIHTKGKLASTRFFILRRQLAKPNKSFSGCGACRRNQECPRIPKIRWGGSCERFGRLASYESFKV